MEPGYTFLAKLESVSLKYVNGGNFNDALGEKISNFYGYYISEA